MSQQVGPLDACLDELRAHLAAAVSGTFYLACDDHSSAAIRFSQGIIESVNFQGRRGDFAVELAGKLAPIEAETFRNAVARAVGQEPAVDGQGGRRAMARHRQLVEKISFAFLGPIAGVLCKKAFAECGDLPQVIDELAGNLPPNEAGNFRNEIAPATRWR